MPKNLQLSAYKTNGEIKTDGQSGQIWIKGFIGYDQRNFFQELIDWLPKYFKNPQNITKLHFCLEDVPGSIAREINTMLYTIEKNYLDEHNVQVFWYYEPDDDDLLEAGEDFECISKIPFNFIEGELVTIKKQTTVKGWEFIKRANEKISAKDFNQAFDYYNTYLNFKNESWKTPFLKTVKETVLQINASVVFTGLFADLILLTEASKTHSEKHIHAIYMFHFIDSGTKQHKQNISLKQIVKEKDELIKLLNEILPEGLFSDVKVVVLDSEFNNRFMEKHQKIIQHDDVFYSGVNDFTVANILKDDELDEVSDNFTDFVNNMAVYLQPKDYLDYINPESNTESENENIEVVDIAPDNYKDFTFKLFNAFAVEPDIDKAFSLSLNMVVLSHKNIDTIKIAEHFAHTVFGSEYQESNTEIVRYRFNEIESSAGFHSFLNEKKYRIVLIENLEKEIKAERLMTLDVSKSDLINQLCEHIEKDKSNIYILALDKHDWEKISAHNPLLNVCFQNIFQFHTYKAEHLKRYFLKEVDKSELEISTEAIELAEEYFKYMQSMLAPGLYKPAIANMLAREVHYHFLIRGGAFVNNDSNIVTKDDIYNSIKDEYETDDVRQLNEIMLELDQLIGLESVKQNIKERAALVKMSKLRNTNNSVSLNAIFSGNPGTGKTTVANILGEIYKSIGVLSKGHVVTVKRHDVVDQYIGYTARNMKQYIDQARGGILFIDEAYALYKKDNDRDFGVEAIDTLVAEMENIKDSTCVILAGYPKPMLEFLNSNPGLASRFPNNIDFCDYTDNDLYEIFINMLKKEKYIIDAKANVLIKDFFGEISTDKTEHFGNARECRNIFEKLKLIQASRIIYNQNSEREDLNTFNANDIKKFTSSYKNIDEVKTIKNQIGFIKY